MFSEVPEIVETLIPALLAVRPKKFTPEMYDPSVAWKLMHAAALIVMLLGGEDPAFWKHLFEVDNPEMPTGVRVALIEFYIRPYQALLEYSKNRRPHNLSDEGEDTVDEEESPLNAKGSAITDFLFSTGPRRDTNMKAPSTQGTRPAARASNNWSGSVNASAHHPVYEANRDSGNVFSDDNQQQLELHIDTVNVPCVSVQQPIYDVNGGSVYASAVSNHFVFGANGGNDQQQLAVRIDSAYAPCVSDQQPIHDANASDTDSKTHRKQRASQSKRRVEAVVPLRKQALKAAATQSMRPVVPASNASQSASPLENSHITLGTRKTVQSGTLLARQISEIGISTQRRESSIIPARGIAFEEKQASQDSVFSASVPSTSRKHSLEGEDNDSPSIHLSKRRHSTLSTSNVQPNSATDDGEELDPRRPNYEEIDEFLDAVLESHKRKKLPRSSHQLEESSSASLQHHIRESISQHSPESVVAGNEIPCPQQLISDEDAEDAARQ
ncbi:hypothetical protein BZA70DRAFT_286478 [Myxozyma melibiosi]|uniref:Uncharacterized protein n=1 Tax=Myxozyma melibiosi TaxID=54550 RepID=A0ABR1FB76_9ASCO